MSLAFRINHTFSALAATDRLVILLSLASGPMGIDEIAEVAGIAKQTAYRTISKLRSVGLVTSFFKDRNKEKLYRLSTSVDIKADSLCIDVGGFQIEISRDLKEEKE